MEPESLERGDAPLPASGFHQAIACSRLDAAQAARDMLLAGGNAVDAAAAALLVLCVTQPWNVGLGGYGSSFVLYRAKTRRVYAIDATSRAPRNFDPATFNDKSSKLGYLAVGVPGVVAGLEAALRQYGTMPFKTVSQPALALAEDGFIVYPRLAQTFDALVKNIDPVSLRAYFPDGPPQQGTTWKQTDLARLIRQLGDEGLASFYIGEIARMIARQVQAGGGVLSEADFHDFRASLLEPLHINYRGYDLYTPPPPSAGLTAFSILKTLEQFDLSQHTPWAAPYYDVFARVSQLAWQERRQFIGDPDFVNVPVKDLLSAERAIDRADAIRQKQTAAPPKPDDPSHTVNVVVVDKDQNVVSWTATHGEEHGAHVAIEGLGLMLGHGMSRFDLDPASPNAPADGKRPQHNMMPVVILKGGQPYAGVGMPGGPRIVSVTTQTIVSLLDFNATPQQAIAAPRLHRDETDLVQVNFDMPKPIIDELRRLGHNVEYLNPLGGETNAIVIEPKSGNVHAAASRESSGVLVF
jgi:gamma-glutamyltranspeptidase/glutathione hydrolase